MLNLRSLQAHQRTIESNLCPSRIALVIHQAAQNVFLKSCKKDHVCEKRLCCNLTVELVKNGK